MFETTFRGPPDLDRAKPIPAAVVLNEVVADQEDEDEVGAAGLNARLPDDVLRTRSIYSVDGDGGRRPATARGSRMRMSTLTRSNVPGTSHMLE